MSYVYRRSEPGLWTVGFYDPDGKFQTDSDHGVREEAAARVAFLNGGGVGRSENGCDDLVDVVLADLDRRIDGTLKNLKAARLRGYPDREVACRYFWDGLMEAKRLVLAASRQPDDAV